LLFVKGFRNVAIPFYFRVHVLIHFVNDWPVVSTNSGIEKSPQQKSGKSPDEQSLMAEHLKFGGP
jgi:hypothetical protein